MALFNIHPLDFVKTKPFSESQCVLTMSENRASWNLGERTVVSEQIGLVTEITNDGRLSVVWIGPNQDLLKNAWWEQNELEKVDSLPRLLARQMANPFGNGNKEVDKYFK